MQLYAFDENFKLIAANHALKQHNYVCLECKSTVRLRGGMHRRKHFYHVDQNRVCSLHKKSMEHIQIQCFFQNKLGLEDCSLEYRFAEINRIADVVWHSKKYIFEIQCSFISAAEVSARNVDYNKCGYQVIWVLHDKRYNQIKLSAMEIGLRKSPYYYTNICVDGFGIIYDQFDIIKNGLRLNLLSKLPVNIEFPQTYSKIDSYNTFPKMIMKRIEDWPIYFEGDLLFNTLHQKHIFDEYLTQAKELELEYFPKPIPLNWIQKCVMFIKQAILRPYNLFFQLLLEKACK